MCGLGTNEELAQQRHSCLIVWKQMKQATLRQTKSTIRFSAKLLRPQVTEKTGSWSLTLPKIASAKLPSRGRTMVEGMINSFPFERLSNQTEEEVIGSGLTRPCVMPQAQMLSTR